ncbi:MAG: hypothetical protein QGF31_05745 [Nitrospinota bacterium]|nr:hypothetical protein [Nitrospinota bacterium]
MTEFTEENLRIDENTYLRTAKILDFIVKFLNVNIRLHEANDTIEKGDIFSLTISLVLKHLFLSIYLLINQKFSAIPCCSV